MEWRGIRRFCMLKGCSVQRHSGENAQLKILLNIAGEFRFSATLVYSAVTFNLRP
jgi:hypothetical protein